MANKLFYFIACNIFIITVKCQINFMGSHISIPITLPGSVCFSVLIDSWLTVEARQALLLDKVPGWPATLLQDKCFFYLFHHL